ncbi:hypothetical protein [Thiocapsa sp.]|uniref:hypothetical protein n=1 Tax=Thiocapsa sp. TaxID=2024551 RepID=UPI0035946508
MNESDRRFWPLRPRTSIAYTILILVALLSILIVLKGRAIWPIGPDSDTTVLIGLVLVSLLPVLLAILDVIIERGGVIEYGGVRIDFSRLSQIGVPAFTVPANIGVPGQPINDTSTTQILDALKSAAACEVITIDIGEGQDWWETRLLVLLAGAARLGRPRAVVFVGTEAGVEGCFQGWGYPVKLLPHLLRCHPQYSRSYHAAQAAARQWALVEPPSPTIPPAPLAGPLIPPWMQPGLATQHPWMAFDIDSGLPNRLLAEQLLASDLGQEIESQGAPRTIGLMRLKEVFQPALYQYAVDKTWPEERQIAEFFDSDSEYVAIIQKGRYLTLASRLALLNAFLGSLIEKSAGKTFDTRHSRP